jgi:hypothetical protein
MTPKQFLGSVGVIIGLILFVFMFLAYGPRAKQIRDWCFSLGMLVLSCSILILYT